MPVATAQAFWQLAQNELRTRLSRRQFIAHFGYPSGVVAEVWERLQPSPEGSSERHLLWMLAFLKMYKVEEAAASRFGVTEKTWRKWV